MVARVPPHVKALAALQALVAEDLVAKGDIEQFYHRISGILREYIEDRFGLLEGVGKVSKNVRLKSVADFNEPALRYYITQAIEHDKR